MKAAAGGPGAALALLLLAAAAGALSAAVDPAASSSSSCCGRLRESPMCRDVCEQVVSAKSESRLRHLLQRAPEYCPASLAPEAWACMNASLGPGGGGGAGGPQGAKGWAGLGCCELAIALECRRACKQASSKGDLARLCRKEHESSFFGCIDKNEMGSVCCGYAGRHTNCREYCEAIFRTDSSPSPSQIRAVENFCAAISPQLIRCVNNYTQSYPMRDPSDSLYCCERAEDLSCQVACKKVLMSKKTELEIIDGLIEGCKTQPLPQDPLWQCFLESSRKDHPGVTVHPPPSTGIDGAKLHCCAKANTSTCRDLCTKLFSTSWGNAQSWQEFDRYCEYNPGEVFMLTCLADVREPCQLGCRNLSFCTHFNNRPTELFRSCNAQSDQGAMNDIKLWEKGSIQMPFMNIPVLDIKHCEPNLWKAVACTLQIKPCHSKSRGSIICKSDCVDILMKCGDQNMFPEGHTAESICELLSPIDDSDNCIPLDTYLTSSSVDHIAEDITHPCNPNPCQANELCEVNRKGCRLGENCLPYSCVPGCKLGDASDFLVRQGTLIQVPVSAGEVGCYKICTCGQSGLLEDCMEMHCVDLQKSCIVGGQRKNHGTSFNVDCNVCSCNAGHLICSTRQCVNEHPSDDERYMFTGLPCNCADQFVPVCGKNGRSYPSACIARCAGLVDNQFEFGLCASKDPCTPNPCPKNLRCIPKRQVCLTSFEKFGCIQHECVLRQGKCDQHHDPVCDTENVEHSNICTLYQKGKQLSYSGACQSFCKATEPVCGHNGETYSNVCAAYSERVAVDYFGRCQDIGILSDFSVSSECVSVKCPPLSAPGCKPVLSPGACCPLCAGMLRILFDKDRLDTFAQINKKPVTSFDILQKIRLHISVPQCDVFGYLSIESEMVILIIPTDKHPKQLQIEACNKEAEKIDSLINTDSPTLASHVPLSALVISQVQVSFTVSSSSGMTLTLLLHLFCSIIIIMANTL